MKIRNIILFLALFLIKLTVTAQVFNVSGTVIDSVTKEKLAFVNIIVNEDRTYGTTTDIDGNFNMKSKNEIKELTFSYVGYKKKTLPVDFFSDRKNKVTLSPESIELQEVVVHAGENPAHRIIDSIVKHRKRNNPEMLDSYSYTIYDQMIITFDTTQINDTSLINLNKLVRDNDIMVMETVSEQYHKRPNKNKREIKANIIAGLQNPMYFFVLDGLQSTSFYEDFITVYEKNYVNPITPGSKSRYFFGLESVMPTAGGDSLYTISFKPRRGTAFEALKGVMTITSDGWAIVNVKAEAADKSNTLDVKIQQLYSKINDSVWFPVQLNTDIVFLRMLAYDNAIEIGVGSPENTNTSLNGIGKSYISNIKINPQIDNKVFGSTDIDLAENTSHHDDEFWKYYRNDSINERILHTYRFIDTIIANEKIDVDKIMNTMTTMLSEGSIPMGYFNLGLSEILNYNIANNFYVGLGMTTNEKLSKHLRFGGYFGYWFGPKHVNYGGNIDLKFNRKLDLGLQLNYDHIYKAVGDYGFINGTYNVFDDSFFKYYYIKWTTLNTSASAELYTRFAKVCKGFVNFSINDKEMYDWYNFNSNGTIYNGKFRTATLGFKMRIAFGERYMLSPKGLVTITPGKPVLWLSYQKGLKDVFESPFDFDRLQMQLSHSWMMPYIGKSKMVLQAGCVFGDVPLMETFNIFANNEGFGLYATESFATMQPNEFLCDKFVLLFLNHNFGKFFKTKHFSPDFIIETNMGWGDISDVYKHAGLELKSMKDGYFESGLVIDNILRVTFTKIGFGAFYRYGAYSNEKGIDNWAFKLKISFKL